MQKAIKFFPTTLAISIALFVAPLVANSQTASAKDSVVTVEQLLKLDNAQARANATKELAASGLAPNPVSDPTKKGGPAKPPEIRASLSVAKIAGVGSNLRADLNYNGQTFNGASVGSRVGPCSVASIAGQCVTLSVLSKPQQGESDALAKGKSRVQSGKAEKPTSPLLCPSSCWTGVPAFDPSRSLAGTGAPGSVASAISGPVLPPSGVPGQAASPMQMYAPVQSK